MSVSPEGALITGVLVLSGAVGVMATAEIATEIVNTGLHAVDTAVRTVDDLGQLAAGGAGGVTVTVAARRSGKKGGKR
ncbi:hypothetical protein [Streptomyces sp. PSAA01]|uniref:hypothetical protein n=1 Tax=Streptomyces sp. PSAA01 TaxID=2912762 RepID=UPI001F3CBAEB|nr:hypothetical protein [Streptomyces sp. PSAA01]MCG0290975.1 hypothetical protein [Streptomyces sp. PSAA01]